MRTLMIVGVLCVATLGLNAKEVTVSVVPDMDTTSDPLTLRIKITNDTDQYIAISKIEAGLPAELYDQDVGWTEQFDLPAGHSKSLQVQVPRLALKTRLRFAFHRPKTEQVLVSAWYTNAGETVQRPTAQAEAVITPLAPGWIVFFGGVVGVIVVVVFKYLVNLAQASGPTPPPSTPGPPAPPKPKWWVTPALGVVVVLLAVMVFRFTATQFPDLPVTVNVKDVYGGFALGLVFHSLTDFFKNALQS